MDPPWATPSVKIQILNMAENIKKTTNLSVVYEIFSILRTRLQNWCAKSISTDTWINAGVDHQDLDKTQEK